MQLLRRIAVTAAGLALLAGSIPASAAAQGRATYCPAGNTSTSNERVTQDACEKAIDVFNLMVPQLSVALTGGNPVLGVGGTLGGLGNFSVSLRATVLQGDLPRVDQIEGNPQFSPNGAQVSEIPTQQQILGLPQVDAAIGLYRGFPVGVTNVGGIDLLLNGAYIPDVEADNLNLTGGVAVGYGVRVGLIQETLLLPGISASYFVRPLPKVSVEAFTANDTLRLREFDVSATSWRLTASKNLMFVTLSAGAGQDQFDADAELGFTVRENVGLIPVTATSQVRAPSFSSTRWNYFGGASINLLMVKLVAEAGVVRGGDEIPTFNVFTAGSESNAARIRPAVQRPYFSAGVRIGF